MRFRRTARAALVGAATALAGALTLGAGGAGEDVGLRICPDLGPRCGPCPPPVDATDRTILFGDLHAHTTLSYDAQLASTGFLSGDSFALPDEACEFARHCAALDFWSINDHAELVLPAEWRGIKEAVRACNARYGGDGEAPEMVTYLGWEWSQVSLDAEDHYGHKNVIFRETADDRVPARPIGFTDAAGVLGFASAPDGGAAPATALAWALAAAPEPTAKSHEPPDAVQRIEETAFVLNFLLRFFAGLRQDLCPTGIPVRDLPETCQEIAPTPADLYRRLDDWGFDALVIPHGNAWGFHTPFVPEWTRQLGTAHRDPRREVLFEVYSGHGTSEVYRPWRPFAADGDGAARCPEPAADYEPCCWRAGEIARAREPACRDEPASAACDEAVREARARFLDASFRGLEAIEALYPDDPPGFDAWRDCGQCRDCFNPASLYRPTGGAQAALADSVPAPNGGRERYRFGFIGSTDEHRGTPGVGYKDLKALSEVTGFRTPEEEAQWRPVVGALLPLTSFERQGAFWFAGGLAAVHSEGRSREAIWSALARRETYATSGKRILLWFDALVPAGADVARVPMGGGIATDRSPIFRAKALGDWRQAPGCPAEIAGAKGAEFVHDVCRGECYHPTGDRHAIDRFEVVRIRPRTDEGESLDSLIDDPWRVFGCAPTPEGCEIRFTDPDYAGDPRPSLYYVRAVQEATPTLNGAQQRCAGYDGTECTGVKTCLAGYRGEGDDCLALAGARAWSSPIYVDPPAGGGGRALPP